MMDDFKPASEIKEQPEGRLTLQYIEEALKRYWQRMYGEMPYEKQKELGWPNKNVTGIIVRCPCSQLQEAMTLKTKTCVHCGKEFKILPERGHSRIVFIPNMGIYWQLYYLTFYRRYPSPDECRGI